MIKLIVGTKGSGKTKAMIDQINDAVKTSKGNVVVVEKGMKLTYDIAPAARLIDLDEYKISGGEMLYGFVAGLMASNYDITDPVSYTHLATSTTSQKPMAFKAAFSLPVEAREGNWLIKAGATSA